MITSRHSPHRRHRHVSHRHGSIPTEPSADRSKFIGPGHRWHLTVGLPLPGSAVPAASGPAHEPPGPPCSCQSACVGPLGTVPEAGDRNDGHSSGRDGWGTRGEPVFIMEQPGRKRTCPERSVLPRPHPPSVNKGDPGHRRGGGDCGLRVRSLHVSSSVVDRRVTPCAVASGLRPRGSRRSCRPPRVRRSRPAARG